MSPEDLQGQVARSAAVERELREQIGKLRAELAEAKKAAARTCYQGGTAAGEVLAKMQAENSRLQRDVLTALVLLDKAKVQREGGRTDAIAMERSAREVLRALVPVVCEHCPDHPHPLNDDNRECKRPRPASHRHASPDPAVGPAQDGAGADLPRSGIPLIDHDYVGTPHPAVDACDKRVSDDPDGRPSRQCGRPRREHREPGGGK